MAFHALKCFGHRQALLFTDTFKSNGTLSERIPLNLNVSMNNYYIGNFIQVICRVNFISFRLSVKFLVGRLNL